MIHIEFSEDDKKALHFERFNNPNPRIQLKMDVLWLKSHSLPHRQICELTCISGNTLRSYLKEYKDGGIDCLKKVHYLGSKSELAIHKVSLEEEFRQNPPATSKEALARIEQLTEIKRSPSQVRAFMHKTGMKCRKVAVIPAKADPAKQAEFKEKELMPRLEEAKRGERTVFFVDSAHFVLGAFIGMLWSFSRIFIPAPSGRQRFNVLGALNAVSHELVTVTNTDYINANTVCNLLSKISSSRGTSKITLVMDNARYQRCKLVQELAEQLEIELLFLPSYSPNLNLIERLWKFVKKKCLYSKYYSNFDLFKNAITTCLEESNSKHKDELDSLLTLNFQTFEDALPFAA